MNSSSKALWGMAVAGLALAAPAASAATVDLGNTQLTVGGYIKLDAMITQSDGEMTGPARDYYRGARLGIPTDDPSGEGKTVFDMHAKQTRFNFKTVTELGGEKLTSFIEMDFMESAQGNELVSNSSSPRIRHAFLSYGNWLMGQTWSTFFNVGALPETIDFIGPAESTVFIRQSQIRYTSGNWQVAVENPQSRVTLADGSVLNEDDNMLPDIALRMNFGPIVLAGLVRSISVQDAAGTDESKIGGGLSLSGKFVFGKDDLKFMLTAGSGLGRYVGVIGNEDGRVLADGSIETNDLVAGFVAYRHHWNEKARSSIVLGAFSGDEDGGGLDTASSVHVNYLYSPVKPLTVGVELISAQKENFDGSEGAFTRLQFGAKLAF